MSKQEIEIIRKLSASSSRPSPEFRQELLNKILAVQEPDKERKTFMSNLKLIYALSFALLVVGGFGAFKVLSNGGDQQIADSSQLPINDSPVDSSLAISLPSVQLETFEEAESAVDFELYQPSQTINEEAISSIEKVDGMLGENSDSIYIKYSDPEGVLYKVSQSEFIGSPAEDFEEISLNFLGQTVTARFTQIATLENDDPNSEASIFGYEVPSSYLAWEYNEIGYEISEFGRVSQDQLVQLAESMQ